MEHSSGGGSGAHLMVMVVGGLFGVLGGFCLQRES
jgi:hypothetical protein